MINFKLIYKSYKKYIIFMVIFIVCFLKFSFANNLISELEEQIIDVDGIKRYYYIHYPNNVVPKLPKPAFFLLHGGGGGNPKRLSRRTNLNILADQNDFVAIYPIGLNKHWNDGRRNHSYNNIYIDDVKFISKIIDRLIDEKIILKNKVYIAGISNGGMMTYRLGIEITDKITAIAAIIANLPSTLKSKVPKKKLPVLIINGTLDGTISWDGGYVGVFKNKKLGTVSSTNETVMYWVKNNELSLKPQTYTLSDVVKTDNSYIEVDRYTNNSNSIEVILYRVVNGGHGVPGIYDSNLPLTGGYQNLDIDAIKGIWNFFKKY